MAILIVALVAISVPAVWVITRNSGDVTIKPVAEAKPVAQEEPEKPQETSFWSSSTEVKASTHADRAPVELGTRFTAAKSGSVTGVRFYKAPGEKGKHTGSLWDAKGHRLAQVTFAGESPSGWQEASFSSPVRLEAKQIYTVSYHSTNGTYVGTQGSVPTRSGPLSTTSRNSGVFGYGGNAFPKQSNPKGYNYWVDVVFSWGNRRPRPGGTHSPRPTVTVTASQTGLPTPTTGPSGTINPTSTGSPSPSTDPTVTISPTTGSTVTVSPTPRPTPTGSRWPTSRPTPTWTRWPTSRPTPTWTRWPTPRPTRTHTPTPTPTRTHTPTPEPTLSPEPTDNPGPGGRTCVDFPTPACTGVPPGTKLTEKRLNDDGAYRVTTPGAVLNAVHIPGDLLITANNVTVKNSQIDGLVINELGPNTYSFKIYDSTVGVADRCQSLPGIGESKFTAERVLIRNHGDGFRASGDDIVIRDSFVDLCSNPGDHSDGIQTYYTGRGLTFDHNTVDQRGVEDITAPIFLTDPQIVDVSVTNNLVMGGTYSIQLKNARGSLVVRGNKIVDKTWEYEPVEADCDKIDWSDNSIVTIDRNYNVTSTVGPLPCAK
ncbi:DUF4082 domain-containing protein [Streptosporangium sp. NPDC051023]|uniref:DUF4082 domain-containing protein n=1 Tax=Streptosporangium sp. NPDC051023 TaxID=3155410 RepID=UPI00344D7382